MRNEGTKYEELSEYERLRLERIKRNEEYLDKLGLSSSKKEQLNEMTKRRIAKKRVLTVNQPSPGDRRSSKRIKSRSIRNANANANDDELVQLSYAEADDQNIRVVKQSDQGSAVELIEGIDSNDANLHLSMARSPRTLKFTYDSDVVLSEEEKRIFAKNDMDQNYLDKFREFLVYHDKISAQNERNVMRQVTKLATGEGVRYESPKYGWPEGCYFMKGTKVTPLSDLVDLMQQAIEAENKHGIDRGNGWLLRHPLKKLLLFQQFCLNNPDFLTTTSKLATYCREASY